MGSSRHVYLIIWTRTQMGNPQCRAMTCIALTSSGMKTAGRIGLQKILVTLGTCLRWLQAISLCQEFFCNFALNHANFLLLWIITISANKTFLPFSDFAELPMAIFFKRKFLNRYNSVWTGPVLNERFLYFANINRANFRFFSNFDFFDPKYRWSVNCLIFWV